MKKAKAAAQHKEEKKHQIDQNSVFEAK